MLLLNSKYGGDNICRHFWHSQTKLLNLVCTISKSSLILPLIFQPYLSSVLSTNHGFFLDDVRCYRIIQESGIKTDFPIYVVGVFSGDKMIAEGTMTEDYVQVAWE